MPLKAELHCHIEGAAAPELVLRQARKYARDASPYIRDGAFVWDDFTSFLAAYDFSADLFRTEEDYALLAEHYLTSLARDGAIYSEIFTSPDHAGKAGLSPKAYTDALGEGILRARAKTGIEGRMIVTGDPTQIDLPPNTKSGLVEALRILDGISGVVTVRFNDADVVRHALVAEIVRAYDRDGKVSRGLGVEG